MFLSILGIVFDVILIVLFFATRSAIQNLNNRYDILKKRYDVYKINNMKGE